MTKAQVEFAASYGVAAYQRMARALHAGHCPGCVQGMLDDEQALLRKAFEEPEVAEQLCELGDWMYHDAVSRN